MAINSKWTDKDREIILDLLASGKSLREICRAEGMPSDMLVRKWARQDPDFGSQYARAREDGMDAMADELLAIADDKSGDFVIVDGKPVLDREAIERAKIRIAARQWTMSKIAPKQYGDKTAVEITEKTFVAELPAVATSTDAWLKATQKGMNGHINGNGKANGNGSEH